MTASKGWGKGNIILKSHSLQIESPGDHEVGFSVESWDFPGLLLRAQENPSFFSSPFFPFPGLPLKLNFLLSAVYLCSFKNVGKVLSWQAVT